MGEPLSEIKVLFHLKKIHFMKMSAPKNCWLSNVFLFNSDCFDVHQAWICQWVIIFFKRIFNVASHFVQQGVFFFFFSHNGDLPAEYVCFGDDEYLWVLNCFLCWKGVWTENWDLLLLATMSSCWNSTACFYRTARTELCISAALLNYTACLNINEPPVFLSFFCAAQIVTCDTKLRDQCKGTTCNRWDKIIIIKTPYRPFCWY